jgi:hypothetical protein
MRALEMESVFPLPLGALWELLHAHVDEVQLREIHPWMISGRTIRESDPVEFQGLWFPRAKVAERMIRIGGRPTKSTWTYRIEPPNLYAYEMALGNGSTLQFENVYSSIAGGTLVKTKGEISLKGVPSFLAAWLVKRSFNRSDREDLAYAARMHSSNPRST